MGGVMWYRQATGWRAAVPVVQPVMPEALAVRVEAAIGEIWAGGEGAKRAAGELARLYHANGFTDEAETVYAVLCERDATDPRWAYGWSELLGTAGRLAESEPLLRHVVTVAPEYGLARRKLADVLLKQGKGTQAKAVYESVLAEAPGDAFALLGLARIAVEEQRWLDARRHLEDVVGRHPMFAGGLSLLATVDDVLGETKRAAEMRRRAEAAGRFRAERDLWAEELLAYCFTSYGLRVAAAATDDAAWSRELLERAAELEPDVAANWQQWGRVLQEAKDWDGAERAYVQGLVAAPNDAQIYQDWVRLAREQRDLAMVFRVVEAGLAQCPDDAGLNYEWGRALVQQERLTEAVGPLERAVALDPYNQTAALELVAVWFRLGEPERAETELLAALERDPDFAPLLEFLVRFHVRGGRRAEAAVALERLAAAPNSTDALRNARQEFTARFGERR